MNLLVQKSKKEVFNVSELSKKFLEYIDVSQKTVESYTIALRQFAKWVADNNVGNPTREDIINYREYLKSYLKPTSVNSYMIAVRNFFKYLEYERLYKNITENVKDIKLEKKHLKRALTSDEIKTILSNCSNLREEVLIQLMATCGLRESEIVNIQLNDFYKEDNVIMLKIMGKGRQGLKSDVVKVDDRVFDNSLKYIEQYQIKDYLFVSNCHRSFGKKMSTRGIRQIITDLFKKSNIDLDRVTPHSLRHFTATQAIKNGFSLLEVSETLRHSSVTTSQIYIDELNKCESKVVNTLADAIF